MQRFFLPPEQKQLLALQDKDDPKCRLLFIEILLSYCSDAPEEVSIFGPTRIRRGENLHLECCSSPGVPAPKLRWRILETEVIGGGDEGVDAAELAIVEEDNGGLTASSWLTVTSKTRTGQNQAGERGRKEKSGPSDGVLSN